MRLAKFISLQGIILSILLVAGHVATNYFDGPRYKEIQQSYTQSPIYRLERSVFMDYLARQYRIYQRVSESDYKQFQNEMTSDQHGRVVDRILSDRAFIKYLQKSGSLYFTAEKLSAWQDQREALINDKLGLLITHRFGVFPEAIQPADLLTYAFIQPTVLMLALNVTLLILLAPLISTALGPGRAMPLFIGLAISTALIYCVFASEKHPILLGSSGAIAGMIGVSSACLFAGFLQDYRAASTGLIKLLLSLSLLALLCGKGFVALVWADTALLQVLVESSVFFLGVAVYLMHRQFNSGSKSASRSPRAHDDWQYRVELAEAMEDVTEMKFNHAANQLRALVKAYPGRIEALRQLYQVEKLRPEKKSYWRCAKALIKLGVRYDDYALMQEIFADIQEAASDKDQAENRLAPSDYHKIMTVFVHHGDLTRAEKTFRFLEIAGDTHIIREACAQLEREFKLRGLKDKAYQYQVQMQRY